MKRCRGFLSTIASAAILLMASGIALGQTVPNEALIKALQHGGLVVVMRHASSPREAPGKQTANSDNINLERQLDAAGRNGATAMGDALRTLKIPVGDVLTSPAYRALETVRLAHLPAPRSYDELGDGGQSMQGVADSQGAWLRGKVRQPVSVANTFIVTHLPNITRAFPDLGSTVSDGEALVFRPDGKGGTALVGRIQLDASPRLR